MFNDIFSSGIGADDDKDKSIYSNNFFPVWYGGTYISLNANSPDAKRSDYIV